MGAAFFKKRPVVLLPFAMAQMPKPLMRRDQALDGPAPVVLGGHAATRQHVLQRAKQLLGHLKVLRVAGMMERNQNLVGKPPAVAGRYTWATYLSQLHIAFGKITHRLSVLPHSTHRAFTSVARL
jgi:hypothetical protein